ncbi:MAG: hypothetical protein R6W94_01225 [Spirochaetia bacterium]
MKSSVFFVVILVFAAAAWPHGAVGQSAEQSGSDSSADDSPLVERFVRDFNAGEIDALAKEYADRLDWRLFAWAGDLGHLEMVPSDDTDSYVEEHITTIAGDDHRTATEKGWAEARSGADEHDLRWVLVNADGFAGVPELGVPAAVFGVVEQNGEESFAVGTVFIELIEEITVVGRPVSAIVEQGIGVDPQRAR